MTTSTTEPKIRIVEGGKLARKANTSKLGMLLRIVTMALPLMLLVSLAACTDAYHCVLGVRSKTGKSAVNGVIEIYANIVNWGLVNWNK